MYLIYLMFILLNFIIIKIIFINLQENLIIIINNEMLILHALNVQQNINVFSLQMLKMYYFIYSINPLILNLMYHIICFMMLLILLAISLYASFLT